MFTWQTTEIVEIVEQKENYIKFKTQNSEYELFTLAGELKNMLDDLFENL